MHSLKVVYRATVMISTLVVGALAYRAYGPQLEKLQPIVERVRQLVAEACMPDPAADQLPSEDPLAAPPAEFEMPAEPLVAAEPPPLIDANVQRTASWDDEEPTPPPATTNPPSPPRDESSVAVLVQQLNGLGVTEYSLTKWGNSGQAYRFHCSVPWGPGGHYARHFDAIADDPADAARQVLEQVQQSQTAN